MTVFISASNRWTGLYWKEYLQRHGQVIVSTWHDQPTTSTRSKMDHDKVCLADSSFEEIKRANALLLIDDPDMVPGGKFVDAGYALGLGKPVILVGRRENLKMWASNVISVTTETEVIKALLNPRVIPAGG